MRKFLGVAIAAALTITAASNAVASECGLSCCIAAGVEGIGSSTGLTITTQYERMDMQDIHQGSGKVSPASVINYNLTPRPNGSMYIVPTKMVMQKLSINAAYRMDENNAFVLTLPYIINDMDMQMGMKTPMGIMLTDMKMDSVSGLGDVSLIYLHDLYKDAEIRPRQRFSVGLGIKAPTGNDKHRQSSGDLTHMMMQAGTGSWDGILLANGSFGFGSHDEDGGVQWTLSPSLIYQANTKNDLGYRVGNRLNYDLSFRYRMTSTFNFKIDLNGIWAGSDSTDGTIDSATGNIAYQDPMMNMLDDVRNTGINSLYIAPGFQWVAGDDWNISAEYRIPVYQNATGTQIVVNSWYFVRATVRF